MMVASFVALKVKRAAEDTDQPPYLAELLQYRETTIFCDHPLLFSYLFRDIIYHSVPELFASQPQQYGTHSPIVLGRVIHSPPSATISKRITSA